MIATIPFPAPEKKARTTAAATNSPAQKAGGEADRQDEHADQVERERVNPASEQDLADPRRRLANAPERRDPDRERSREPEARQHGDEVRRDAGVEEAGQGRDQRIEASGDEPLALGPRERKVPGIGRRPGRVPVATARNREVEREGQEGQGRVHEHGAPPPETLGQRVPDRPEHRRGEPAQERDLRDRPPGMGAADPGERRERRLVEGEAHREPEAHPGGVVDRDVVRRRDPGASEGAEDRPRHHRGPAAVAVDHAPRQGRGHAGHDERGRQAAVRQRTAPAEIGGDQLAEHADQMVGDAPADELGHAQAQHGPARDHPRASRRRTSGPSPRPAGAPLTACAGGDPGSPGGCRPRC